ncbi:response regulator transcription factor [Pseudonocardia sp.]|uniref:response regulator transcription factor n=1 Tax=Pseudonocardia sp. TaxID=60912 RepID=UPI003D0AD1C0
MPEGPARADWPDDDPEGCYPILLYYRHTELVHVTQLADVPPGFAEQWRSRGWQDLCSDHGVDEQMALPLHVGRTDHEAFVIGRDGAYRADELQLAGYIQRLLVCVARQIEVLSQQCAGATLVAAYETVLTPREVAVITLVAQGMTAAATARRLAISVRTVHKHLERAYAKLDVSDRVSAVRRAMQLGLLPEPPRRPVPLATTGRRAG